MKLVVNVINNFTADDISTLEREGELNVEVNSKMIKLAPEDVEITSQDIEGWLVASSGNITVALDVQISEELKMEGIARELVNRIQNLRKDSGFEVTDTIDVTLLKNSVVENAVLHNMNYIKNETLTANLEFADVITDGTEVSFDDVVTKLCVKKH